MVVRACAVQVRFDRYFLLTILLDLAEEGQFAGRGEEAGLDGVGGEFAELVEGEAVFLVGEDVLVEEVGAEQGGRRS